MNTPIEDPLTEDALFTRIAADQEKSASRIGQNGPSTFDRDAEKALALQTSHVLQTVRTKPRLGLEGDLGADLRAALDALRCGVILVDASCGVWFASQAAERLLAAGDGLVVRHGRLRAASTADNRRLEAVIAAAARAAASKALREVDGVSLARPSGGSPLRVLCIPLCTQRLDAYPLRPTAMVMVTDPNDETVVPDALLRRLYGISAAEARLCVSLMRGLDLEGHAASHGVTPETARSQLKSVFQKTGVNRQIDLLRLLLGGATAHGLLAGTI